MIYARDTLLTHTHHFFDLSVGVRQYIYIYYFICNNVIVRNNVCVLFYNATAMPPLKIVVLNNNIIELDCISSFVKP